MPRHGGWPATGFAARLRALRERAGLSQAELGHQAGIHPQTITKLEAGVIEPGWPVVLLLARALGVTDLNLFAPPGWPEQAPGDSLP